MLDMGVQLAAIRAEERRQKESALDTDRIRRVLEKELSFENGINSNLVSTILDKVIVKSESTKQEIHLDIFLKLGTQFEAVYDPKNLPACGGQKGGACPCTTAGGRISDGLR